MKPEGHHQVQVDAAEAAHQQSAKAAWARVNTSVQRLKCDPARSAFEAVCSRHLDLNALMRAAFTANETPIQPAFNQPSPPSSHTALPKVTPQNQSS